MLKYRFLLAARTSIVDLGLRSHQNLRLLQQVQLRQPLRHFSKGTRYEKALPPDERGGEEADLMGDFWKIKSS